MMTFSSSCGWESSSPLSRRMVAMGIIAEMREVIELLEELNKKLDLELSVEDADIDFKMWLGDVYDIQPIFQSLSYIESNDDNSTINKMPDIFPLSKSTTFKDTTIESLKTGMRQLGSEAVLNHADIASTLINGFGKIVCLLREINEKMTDIPNELYENFCYDFFASDLDLVYQRAEREYLLWKEEHEWKSQQTLEDKRTQEILKLLKSDVMTHSTPPTNREIKECSIKIQEEALEHNTHIPEGIDIECARFAKFVTMHDRIMWFDYAKLGKYLYRHHKDLSWEEELSLKHFYMMLDFIHNDMAVLNPKLKTYLPDYEENQLQAVIENAVNIINTCKPYVDSKLPENFLSTYIKDAFYGDLKQEIQKKLGGKGVYTQICKMLGMLKASIKVFTVGTTSEQLASCLSPLTDKPNKDSMIRKIDEGARELNSKLRNWTDSYIKEHCYTESERLFVGLSEK